MSSNCSKSEETEDQLKAAYQKYIQDKPPREEVHARHILVPTEAEAKAIIDQLKKGADFAKLAKNIRPTRARPRAAISAISAETTWCRNSPTPPSR